MARLDGWQQALAAYLAGVADRPFAWGRNDCFCFCAGAVHAQTGADPMAPWRGRYRTIGGALRLLRRQRHADLTAFWDAQLPRLAGPLLAGRGDLVRVPMPEGPAFAVVDLTGEWVVGVGEQGSLRVALEQADAAWGVGR